MLQCGDPTGTGSGGPDYTIPDENPKTRAAAPSSASAQAQTVESVYPAGDAGHGQHRPAQQRWQPVLHRVHGQLPAADLRGVRLTDAGGHLNTVNRIAAGGLTPSTHPSSGQTMPNDGAPKLKVTITQGTED